MGRLISVIGLLAGPALAGAMEAPAQAPAPPSTAAVPVPAELLAIRSQLLGRVQRGDVPSFALGVVRNRQVTWEEALGWADRENEIPATSSTLYPVASVSKSITATGALALAAAGRLQLDQEVEELLGDLQLRGPSDGVRVSHLLAHTSGIPHLWHYEYQDRPETTVPRQQLIRGHAFVASPPGERFLYTNLGYGVLAQVIENAGGATFQRVIKRALFEPLGMRSTTVDAWVGDKGTVRGYTDDGEAIPYRFRIAPDGGAGFFSSLHDLLRYARFHLGALEQRVPAKDAAITTALGTRLEEGRFYYLRGWGAVGLPVGTVLISDGEAAGGTAVVVVVPEKKLAVVVLCNATGGPAAESAVAILSALIPGFGEQFGEAVGSIERELATPGQLPTARYEGLLLNGVEELAVSVDFSDAESPLLQLGGARYLLQEVGWERGALVATAVGSLPVGAGKGRTHRLVLTLWQSGDELRGVAQEDLIDDRPRFGVPHAIVLKSVQ